MARSRFFLRNVTLVLLTAMTGPAAWGEKAKSGWKADHEEYLSKYRSFEKKAAEFESSPEAKASDVAAKGIPLLEDAYALLEEGVRFVILKPTSGEVLESVVRLASFSLRYDRSGYAGELLLPLYRNHVQELKKSLRSLESAQAKEVLESTELAHFEFLNGNNS